MKRNTFASLGFNCEAAYQFRRVNGGDSASFFSWTYCKFYPLLDIVSHDFDGLLQWENIQKSGIMIWDKSYDVAFHGPVFNETNNGEDVEKAKNLLDSLHSKVKYLADRWNYTTSTAGHTTYFLKIKHNDPRMSAPRVSAVQLRNLLTDKYPNHDFTIVVLQSLESVLPEADWNEARIHNRYLDRYAVDADPRNDAHEPSWDRIFAEFSVRQEAEEEGIAQEALATE